MLIECTVAATEPSKFGYTMVMAQILVAVVAVLTTSTLQVHNAVGVVGVPPAAVVVIVVLLPLHSSSHMFYLEVGHMRDNIYLHAQQVKKNDQYRFVGFVTIFCMYLHSSCRCLYT